MSNISITLSSSYQSPITLSLSQLNSPVSFDISKVSPIPISVGMTLPGPQGRTGEAGASGKEILLQTYDGYIQWKYDTDSVWNNLVSLSSLKGEKGDDGNSGKSIEIQIGSGYIQWRKEGDVSWANLVAISDLKGDKGDSGIPGPGVASGGLTGQLLQKTDSTDYNTQWHTLTQDDVGDGDTYKRFTSTEKSKLSGISSGATVGADWDTNISHKPILGTASAKNIPATGNATSSEVVMGNDSRLFDQRTPVTHSHSQSEITNLISDLASKITGNTAIAGATKTKITYDSKGLVTAGSDATTADIADSTDKRYVTDAQLQTIQSLSGADPGQIDLSGYVQKTTQINSKELSSNITLTQDDIGDGITYKQFSSSEKTKLSGISAGATVGADWETNLSNIPTFGTSSSKNIPASGNASSTEVVLGSDTRLTDSRSPTAHSHSESDITNLVSDLSSKITGNQAITGATKTKITYDTKGLVTSGSDATTADIPDSTNKRYVTDANLTVLQHTSGTNTGDQDLSGLVSKTTTVNSKPLSTNVTLTQDDIGDGETYKKFSSSEKTKLSGISSGATVGADWNTNLSGIPTFGTASSKNVATSGNASSTEVVMGNDTRLTNARTPTNHSHSESDITGLTDDLASKISANPAISGATKTKITYDSKGLVTAGSDATTADISDSSNKRYVTDSQLSVLQNTSGTNTGDQDLSGLVVKTTTVNSKALSSNITLTQDDIGDGTTNKQYSSAEKSKLSGIATGATVGADWNSNLSNIPSAVTNLSTSLASKVDANSSITSATKTKITYDAKGLVTAGADATTADIADSTDKRYVTDAQLTVLGNTSGTNTGDQTLPTDTTISITDSTTNNATTTQHGWSPKASAPASGNLNVLGIANTETARSDKLLLDTTSPSTQAYGDTASAGTSLKAARVDHKHAMPASTKDTTAYTGILKGNGTSISAATAGTDYLAPGGALGTPSSGTLTNCTFPTLNQDTTGKSAKTDAIQSATTTVNVSNATAPSAGQVLTATSSTSATWQTPNGGNSGPAYLINNDFLSITTGGYAPFQPTAISSGTSNAIVGGGGNHPGCVDIKSSTTANSGEVLKTETNLLISGGETFELIFKVAATSGTTCYFGFHDSGTVSEPYDAVCIKITGTTLLGKARSNNTETATASNYTITQGTWYRMKIVVASDAASAHFYLYSEAGTLLWDDTVSSNIPTSSGRELGVYIQATNSGTTATSLVVIDLARFWIDRTLVR